MLRNDYLAKALFIFSVCYFGGHMAVALWRNW